MIKVLHVISGDLWAGAEVMALNLLSRSSESPNIQVCAVLLNEGILASSLRSRGIETSVIDESSNGSMRIFWKLLSIARRQRPDVVHTHRTKENVLGAVVARLRGARTIRTVHGWTEYTEPWWRVDKALIAWLDGLIGRRFQDACVAVSEELRDKLQRIRKLRSITVIENGIDIAAVRAAASNPPAIRIDRQRFNVGIVARLVPVKRHDRFIAAARILVERQPDAFDFHILGDGPLGESIAAEIEASGASSRIHLHGFRSGIEPEISALDALVICSEHEGVPMNALEAASLGVPIVTTPLPSIAKIIASGAPGTVCKDASPETLADAIWALKAVPQRGYPELGPQWPYSDETMAAGYERLYASLLRP